jgi:AmpD protein
VSHAASIPARAFDGAGRLARALQIPSPNFDARPAGSPINLLVVHSISLPPGEFGGPAVIDFFLNRLNHAAHPYFEQIRGMEVSSHFFIRRSGELIQFVPCVCRALRQRDVREHEQRALLAVGRCVDRQDRRGAA